MGKKGGWMGLFGSRASKPKPDPRVRWFGKLPTYADYYCSSTDEEWVVEFHDWILEGFELYLSASREAQANKTPATRSHGISRLPLTCSVIRLPESGMTVFASIQDYGGDMVGRPFPLCLYVGLPSTLWPGPTSDRLTGALRVLQELMSLRREVSRFFKAPGGFKSVFDDRRVDWSGIDGDTMDDTWVQIASRIPLSEWFDSARDGLPEENLAAWSSRVACWGERITAMESRDFEPTLCFPLAASVDLYVQTAGWFRWLETRMDLKRRMLSMLLNCSQMDNASRLVVIARNLSAQDFLLATPLWDSLRYLDHPSMGEQPGNSEGSDSQPGKPLPPPNSIESWADFVQAADKRVKA